MIVNNIDNLENNRVNFYIFGSILQSDQPRDIDLLIVYDESTISPKDIIKLKHKLDKMIGQEIGKQADICMLSLVEVAQSKFLSEEKCRVL
jgi:predicted nucleotidyltransferase